MEPIKMIFVGDVALGDHPKSVGFGFYSRYKDGIPLETTRRVFPNKLTADIVFGNLEFTLANDVVMGESIDQINCRGISKYASFLKEAGFNVVNIANNHIYQHGIDDFNKTINNLALNNIHAVGLRDNYINDDIITVGMSKICFLSWCARPRQGFTDIPPYKEYDEKCYDQIREAKLNSDYVCVSMHWGDEFIQIPSHEERLIARRMIDSGASIVIGHHPHVIREIEEYNSGIIAYSLGNFICDMLWNSKTRETGCLYIELKCNSVYTWKFHNGIIGDDYFPIYFDEKRSKYCDERNSKLFNKLNTKLKTVSYERLSQSELNRHKGLSLIHTFRNFKRYNLKILSEIFYYALQSRLKR